MQTPHLISSHDRVVVEKLSKLYTKNIWPSQKRTPKSFYCHSKLYANNHLHFIKATIPIQDSKSSQDHNAIYIHHIQPRKPMQHQQQQKLASW